MGTVSDGNRPGELPAWRLYERVVAAIVAENTDLELSVTPNACLLGHFSGVERQVDVLIDARWGDDDTARIIVDAKRYSRKLDVKDIEAFLGMMADCRARRGILYAPLGCSLAAERRSRDTVTITVLRADELDESWWAAFEECRGDCQRHPRRRSHRGLVLWDAQHLLEIDGLWAIAYTGKCDMCHNHHVWCWDCGERFGLCREDQHECGCGHLWVSTIEEDLDDESGETLNAVHLLLQTVDKQMLALDQRRLR